MSQLWYVKFEGNEAGPLTTYQLKELAKTGDIWPSDYVRKEMCGEWISAADCDGLFASQPDERNESQEITADEVLKWIDSSKADKPNSPSSKPPTSLDFKRRELSKEVRQDSIQKSRTTTTRCPFCRELIVHGARKCKHCGEILDAELARNRFGVPTQTPVVAPQSWNPGIAAVLNLVLPGSGYIYIGQLARGILLFFGMPLVYFSCWVIAQESFFAFLNSGSLFSLLLSLFLFVLPILGHISILIDPFVVARKRGKVNAA